MKILFLGNNHRMRRRETIMHPPKNVTFVSEQELHNMLPDHELSYNEKKSLWEKFANATFRNHIIKKSTTKAFDAVYSPGKILFSSHTPWIVEIDNIAVLAYYKPWLLKMAKLLFKYKLGHSSCKQIICLSEAAQQAVKQFFNDSVITNKTRVVYPYINTKPHAQQATRPVRFLFVSTHFYLKGGREVLRAFLKEPIAAQLTIVTKTQDILKEDLDQIRASNNIRLVEANMSKEELEKLYLESHVLCVPTLQDSFGMVFLEALAYGLAIISTDQYNLPELVTNNGILIKPPFRYFEEHTQLPNTNVWRKGVDSMIRTTEYAQFTKDVADAITQLAQSPKLVAQMQKNSLELFSKKFSPSIRQKALQEALNFA